MNCWKSSSIVSPFHWSLKKILDSRLDIFMCDKYSQTPPLEFLASAIQPQIILNKTLIKYAIEAVTIMPDRAFSGEGREPMTTNPWPALPLAEWKDTYVTLHVVLNRQQDPAALTPLVNHWWNTTLYVTPRGLTTTAMPYNSRQLQIDFDFIDHKLLIETTDASTKTVALRPCSVAEFYQETMAALRSLDMPVTIWTTPVEVQDRTPFEEDQKHAAYDPEYAQRVWRILVQASRVLTEFRCQFTGKVSPLFFWGF